MKDSTRIRRFISSTIAGRGDVSTEEVLETATELGVDGAMSTADFDDVVFSAERDANNNGHRAQYPARPREEARTSRDFGYTTTWMERVFQMLDGRSKEDIDVAVDALRLFLDKWDEQKGR